MANNIQKSKEPIIVCNNTACRYHKENACTAEKVNIVIGHAGDFTTPACTTFVYKEQKPRSNWGN